MRSMRARRIGKIRLSCHFAFAAAEWKTWFSLFIGELSQVSFFY
jgi:hypothetical protein